MVGKLMGVLGIDTAGPITGIAYVDKIQRYSWQQRVAKGADSFLLERLEWILSHYKPDLVAVSVGPGSFTSLRVGVSIAMGFAESMKLQVVPVSSLEARAKLFPSSCCLSLLDARKNRVYAQLFDSTTEDPIALTEPQDIALAMVLPRGDFIGVGEGAMVYQQAILDAGGFVPCDATRNPALQVAELGALRREQAIDPLFLAIEYIREAGVVPPKNLGIPTGTPFSEC
jgi:tRNA threonylcarbamoyl adenosine modification protein YeaZ